MQLALRFASNINRGFFWDGCWHRWTTGLWMNGAHTTYCHLDPHCSTDARHGPTPSCPSCVPTRTEARACETHTPTCDHSSGFSSRRAILATNSDPAYTPITRWQSCCPDPGITSTPVSHAGTNGHLSRSTRASSLPVHDTVLHRPIYQPTIIDSRLTAQSLRAHVALPWPKDRLRTSLADPLLCFALHFFYSSCPSPLTTTVRVRVHHSVLPRLARHDLRSIAPHGRHFTRTSARQLVPAPWVQMGQSRSASETQQFALLLL